MAYTLLKKDESCSLIATAPESSETHKNSHRNHTLGAQKFKFSRVLMPSTGKADLFESTAGPLLDECLNLENNALLFTYGVTNSGKTYTVQGPRRDAGLLPRSLDLIFNTLGSHIKPKSIFCPHLHSDVCKMSDKLQYQREAIKQRILYPNNTTNDFEITGMTDPNSTKCTVGTMGSVASESTAYDNESYQITDGVTVTLQNAENCQYSVWVSYLELYNENIYDLLAPPPETGEMKPKNRPMLRLGEDPTMSVYVKGSTQLEVCSFAEANRAIVYGQKNRKKAATSMNQSSSRSHAIFKITIIATNTISQQSKSSQITFVDLAGSERYKNTNAAGLRLKEAGNINTSLLTLGKCISSLKHNSKLRPRQATQQQIVPFRESKLTRLFKNFLSGEGLISMIVCVNPHQDFFDESLHALKFSALATEALFIPRSLPSSQTESQTDTRMPHDELIAFEHRIRKEVLAEVKVRMVREREDHEEEIEEVKERERTYYEGIEKGLQEYYAFVIDELKDKVRAARAQNAQQASSSEETAAPAQNSSQEETCSEEQIETLQKECQELKEQLRWSKSEHADFKTEIDQRLFQTKLELKTTQQLYNDTVGEKERFSALCEKKEGEVRAMFQDNEEATKLSTFWEKECVSLKTSHATLVESMQTTIRECEIREQQMQDSVSEKDAVIERLTRENLKTSQEDYVTSALENQIASLKAELAAMGQEKKTMEVNALETTELRWQQAQDQANEIEKLKVTCGKKEKEIGALRNNLTESEALASALKSDVHELREVLSEQESKENREENDVRGKMLAAQEQLSEKTKLISELRDELSDIVRNKSLQFDTLICNKEKECETLQEAMQSNLEQLSDLKEQISARDRQIGELQELAKVQKDHLRTVEQGAGEVKLSLQAEIDRLQEKLHKPAEIAAPHDASKLRLAHELSRQEGDRLKVELATERRRAAEETKKLRETLEAKDIQIQNWYEEKEKAVNLISNKKEKEISALEEQLAEKEKLINNLAKNVPVASSLTSDNVATSEEYQRLSRESTRKLTEMADMVIHIETERDDERTQFHNFKEQIDGALSEKEEEFASLRAELSSVRASKQNLEAALTTAHTRASELESTVSTLKSEMESVEKKRVRYTSTSSDLDQCERDSIVSTRSSSRTSNRSTTSRSSSRTTASSSRTSASQTLGAQKRTSNLNASRSSSRRSSRGTGVRSSRTRPVIRGSTRTSQVVMSRTGLTASRSKRPQKVEESPGSDNFATPEPVGVKRKATLKGIKDMVLGSPRHSKRGKATPIEVSESDSDFATPYQPEPAKSRGKRKLHKSLIGSPDLIPAPCRPGMQDVRPEEITPEGAKSTRSRTKLIQAHLSGQGLRKTRSRNTRI